MNIHSRLKYDKYFFGILLRYNLEMYNFKKQFGFERNKNGLLKYFGLCQNIFSLPKLSSKFPNESSSYTNKMQYIVDVEMLKKHKRQ